MRGETNITSVLMGGGKGKYMDSIRRYQRYSNTSTSIYYTKNGFFKGSNKS